MKLSEIITILKLDKDIPFYEHQYGLGCEYSKTVDKDGIHFWKGETTSYCNLSNDAEYIIDNFIRQRCRIDKDNKYYRLYYTVSSLLYVVGKWQKINDSNFDIDKYVTNNIKKCVSLIQDEIKNNLDFSEVKDMNQLIDIINCSELYQQMLFLVTVYDYSKYTKGYKNYKTKNTYSFGNKKYCEDLDKVRISIYDDCVELVCDREGRGIPYERKLSSNNRIGLSIENKIIEAIDAWNCYYTN